MFEMMNFITMNNFAHKLTAIDDRPPTIYMILDSIVNYGATEKTKIVELAEKGHSRIFNFKYPLSTKVNKDDFETTILNRFLQRRINFQTVTAFKIQLNVKLNEIMPKYNKMFDMFDGWDLFNDGETITRETTDSRNSKNNVTNESETSSESKNKSINDRRFSDTPQSYLDDVQNAEYLTEYNYDTTENNSNDKSNAKGKSESISEDNGKTDETIKRTNADKIRIYNEFLENTQNIYSMIFKDLECLFFGLID